MVEEEFDFDFIIDDGWAVGITASSVEEAYRELWRWIPKDSIITKAYYRVPINQLHGRDAFRLIPIIILQPS